ncbi:unnamed protein product [Lactuca saligna]|nr:unnamed protein product [Lactuca saligna]
MVLSEGYALRPTLEHIFSSVLTIFFFPRIPYLCLTTDWVLPRHSHELLRRRSRRPPLCLPSRQGGNRLERVQTACSSAKMAIPLSNLTPSLLVSKLCLGTMTFGEQNSLSQSFKLLDKAFDSGINFFDSAEMYPVPQRAETQGRSEEYFGRWLRERKIPRDRVVFATKVSGPSGQMSWIRGGPTSLDGRNIKMAIDNS